MTLRLHDSATGSVRDFAPLVAGRASVYLCGATPQGSPHIGHLRSAIAFDVLRRWMEIGHGLDVTLVRNVTDIDDKVLAKSRAADKPWWAWAYRFEREFTAAYDAVGVAPPTYEPRATGHIGDMIKLVERLIKLKHAYRSADDSGDVFFDVRSWPKYGSLSHISLDDVVSAADADPRGKRDPRDFALWKGRKKDEPDTASWEAPFGRGRPGWHLECSAMARRYLGSAFDIHGGGLDLRFPHHENEKAQSCAAGDGFAAFWLHNGLVRVGGEKMSKSLGNSFNAMEAIAERGALGLRYALLAAHYRSVIDYGPQTLLDTSSALRGILEFFRRTGTATAVGRGKPYKPHDAEAGAAKKDLPEAFVAAMDDDLNVPAALAVLFNIVRDGNAVLDSDRDPSAFVRAVGAMTFVLGIDLRDKRWRAEDVFLELDALVRSRLRIRDQARNSRNFQLADSIREELVDANILIYDGSYGTEWGILPR